MPTCGSCGTQWPEGHIRCPRDGTPLVSGIDFTLQSSGGGAQLAHAIDPTDDLPPGSAAGEYEILQKIGEGGMGSVYGARHPLIGKRAAIKVIHLGLSASAEAIERFIREAQAVNQIGHPNIVDVFGFGQLPDGRRFFIMEWLLGESLKQRMTRPLPLEEALDILEDIARALEAAHDAGVLHRDLKPDNVFLQDRKGDRPIVKLLDFGLAKLSGNGERGLDRTRTGVVMGTPLYLSPEQAKGAKVDFATDVYSLGAVAYEMFSGQVPFKADSAVETMALHISQVAIPLGRIKPEIPRAIEDLVRGMLEKDPQMRPLIATVRDQIAQLRSPNGMRSRDSRPSTPVASAMARSDMALATTTVTGPIPKPRRLPVAWIAGAIALAGVGITIAVMVLGRGTHARAQPAVAMTTADAAIEEAHTQVAAPPDAAVPPPTPVDTTDVETTPPPIRTVRTDPVRVAKVGTVVITIAGAPRAKIVIDGKLVGKGVASVTQSLAPGDHTVRAVSKGFKPATSTVRVIGGKRHDVTLTLQVQRSVNAVHDPFEDEE